MTYSAYLRDAGIMSESVEKSVRRHEYTHEYTGTDEEIERDCE